MEFVGTFWALIPPIVAIVLALITKETFSSLFVGILVGAILLACQVGDPVSTLDWIINGTFTPNVSGDTALEAAGALALVPDGGGAPLELQIICLNSLYYTANFTLSDKDRLMFRKPAPIPDAEAARNWQIAEINHAVEELVQAREQVSKALADLDLLKQKLLAR